MFEANSLVLIHSYGNRAAALATACELKLTELGSMYDLRQNQGLGVL